MPHDDEKPSPPTVNTLEGFLSKAATDCVNAEWGTYAAAMKEDAVAVGEGTARVGMDWRRPCMNCGRRVFSLEDGWCSTCNGVG